MWGCCLRQCSREYFVHQTFLSYAHQSSPKWEATPVHCRRWIKASKSPGAKPLSYILFYSFMERHTNLTVLTPKGPDLIRPKGATPEIIKKIFWYSGRDHGQIRFKRSPGTHNLHWRVVLLPYTVFQRVLCAPDSLAICQSIQSQMGGHPCSL